MKKISLKGFCRRYLIQLNMNNDFKVNQMLIDVGVNNIRLYAPLLAWCYLTNKKVGKDSRIYGELMLLRRLYPKPNEEDLIQYCKDSPNIEMNKFIQSFVAYNRQKDKNELKDRYRECITIWQSKLGMSTYQVFKLSNIQASNFYNWYNKNQNDKVSTKKLNYLLNAILEMREKDNDLCS